jgi:hypothetical protein
MPRKKAAPVEEGPKSEEVPFEESGNWNEPSEAGMPKEAMGHMMRAASEFFTGMEGMMPKRTMPPEVKLHYKAAKKEMMLMARAMLDAKIAECDSEASPKEPEPRIRKINLD